LIRRTCSRPIGGGEVETLQWHAVRAALRSKSIEVEDGYSSASEFVEEVLHALSPAGFPLNARGSSRRSATHFCSSRSTILPTSSATTCWTPNRSRSTACAAASTHWRYLSGRIENLKAQSASLSQIQRIVARVNENERIVLETEWQIARLRWEIFFRDARRLQEQLDTLENQAATAKVAAEIAGDASEADRDGFHARWTDHQDERRRTTRVDVRIRQKSRHGRAGRMHSAR